MRIEPFDRSSAHRPVPGRLPAAHISTNSLHPKLLKPPLEEAHPGLNLRWTPRGSSEPEKSATLDANSRKGDLTFPVCCQAAESAVDGRCSLTSSRLLETVTVTSSPGKEKNTTHARAAQQKDHRRPTCWKQLGWARSDRTAPAAVSSVLPSSRAFASAGANHSRTLPRMGAACWQIYKEV